VGAISIAIIFAIMLSQPMSPVHEKRAGGKVARAFAVALLLFVGLVKSLRHTAWPQNPDGDFSVRAIGKNLLTNAVLPFEAVSLVLLIAIIGALVISNTKERSS
jgi:NADH-quinone oxidoreductase subunit J